MLTGCCFSTVILMKNRCRGEFIRPVAGCWVNKFAPTALAPS